MTKQTKKYDDNKSNKAFLVIICFFVCLINFLSISFIFENKVEKVSGVRYREVEEYIFPETLKTEEDMITQYFKPQHDDLKEIKIRLAFNHSKLLKEHGADIRLTLSDDEEEIVQIETIESSALTNWLHYSFILKEPLDRTKTYMFSLEQLTGPTMQDGDKEIYSISWIPFSCSLDKDDTAKENVKCEYNNVLQNYNMDLQYIYKVIDYYAVMKLLLANILCLILVLCCMFFSKKDYFNLSFVLISPIVLFVIVELITGNLFIVKPIYILINIIIIYILEILFLLFFNNKKLAMFSLYAILPCLALVEYYVYAFRGRSFMLQDIYSVKTAQSVMGGYSYNISLNVAIGLLIAISMIYILKQLPQNLNTKNGIKRKVLVVILGSTFGFICMNPGPLQYNSILNFNHWDIESNYHETGYLRSLLAELNYFKVDKPDGYSVQAINTICEKYVTESNRSDNITIPKNIIVIMNEAWSDFRYINSYALADSITPYIDSLTENVVKGYLHVPVFGNGTANSEYEFLTGNCTQFFGATNIAYQFYVHDKEKNIVNNLKLEGFDTIALHPYLATNWNRNNVYSYMGFDKFYASEAWPDNQLELLRWCASDRSTYKSLINLYEQKENEKLFTFLVTMQNHGGYTWDDYTSSVNLTFDEEYPQVEQYLSLLKESDDAFKNLVTYFDEMDEPTMIVMFGDHLPNVETKFYEELFGKNLSQLSAIENQKRYATPFVVWTNYDIPTQTGIEMSANFFGSYVLDLAGLNLTPYDKCILAIKEQIPIIGTGVIADAYGNYYGMNDMPKELENVLNDYKILQYNKVFDRNNLVDELYVLSE